MADMNGAQVMDILRKKVDEAGSQKAFADRHGLSQAYVNDVLRERRDLAGGILNALGFERHVIYRKKAKAQ